MSLAINKAFKTEKSEHPDFTDKQIWSIVRDHYEKNGDKSNAAAAAEKIKSCSEECEHSEYAELSGVEIFMSGTHLGETYTDADVAELAGNTNKLIEMGKHDPPAKLGHSDKQEIAEQAGLPAVGWVSKVSAEGNKLLADFKQVPELVAEAIRKGLYRHVSSEIYLPKATAQYFGEFGIIGKVLRAVAFLGADVPVVKGLKPLMLHESGKGGYKIAVFACRDKHIMADKEPDVDDKGKKPLMVAANRHPYGALVKMAGKEEPHRVDNIHPDGTYDVSELHKPDKQTKAVHHDNLTLLSEQEARGIFESELLILGQGKPGQKTQEEQMAENDAVKLAEQKTADATAKLAEAVKKNAELEAKQRDGRIAAFCEKYKEYITPALRPAFEAVARIEAGVVKLAEKEQPYLEAFLAFAEEFISAKKVTLGEVAPTGNGETIEAEVNLAESRFSEIQGIKNGEMSVTGAELSVRAKEYSEKTGKSFREALIHIARLDSVAGGN